MKGDAKVIEYLNRVLKNELTAINQYFLHARMFKNWGLTKLDEKEYHESVDEMRHADQIIERILFLEGLPNLQDLGRLRVGENTREILEADLAVEHGVHVVDRAEDVGQREDCGFRDDVVERTEADAVHIDHAELRLLDGVDLFAELGVTR